MTLRYSEAIAALKIRWRAGGIGAIEIVVEPIRQIRRIASARGIPMRDQLSLILG